MNQQAEGTDPKLLVKGTPLLLTAFATFGKPSDDPYEVARRIAQGAKLAGFSKSGRRHLLNHIYAFVDELLRLRLNPMSQGSPAKDSRRLFSAEGLAGLFDPPATEPVDSPSSSENEARDRALIEQLIAATSLYETSDSVNALLAFTVRLRAFAPFNAMLLHIQKPGLTHAATAIDWWNGFGRVPRLGVRPLLILRAMGPIDFVFDILDTEGSDLPEHAFTFPTLGAITTEYLDDVLARVRKSGIRLVQLDYGDAFAGWIQRLAPATPPKEKQGYQLAFNRNHPPAVQFVTLAHELAHLYLGHLGEDRWRDIRDRRDRTDAQREIEAEMTAYLVAKRSGVTPRSESYLDAYKEAISEIDLYAVMRAANSVEAAMGVSSSQLKLLDPVQQPG